MIFYFRMGFYAANLKKKRNYKSLILNYLQSLPEYFIDKVIEYIGKTHCLSIKHMILEFINKLNFNTLFFIYKVTFKQFTV